jgi:sodium-dependent dicarboxylate transporter 2/3/5
MTGRDYPLYKKVGLILGPAVLGMLLVLPTPEGMSAEGQRTAAVSALMAIWWITEALPLAATALVPVALYPAFGILPGAAVTRSYGDSNIYLFAGGFFIAMAMQKWNLHERVALNIVYRTGTNPHRLVLGFMLGTAFMSMWISNTATALMMLPIAMAVISQMQRDGNAGADKFAAALLLSIAYASSVGGIATLIGTPPNGVLITQYSKLFPEAPAIGFFEWMLLGVPVMALMLPTVWLLLTRVLYNFRIVSFPAARDEIRRRLDALGRMSRGERVVTTVWALTAFAWIFMEDIDVGAFVIPGWTGLLLPQPGLVNHGTIAIAAAIVLFLVPVDASRGEFALDWEWAKRIPWDVLILFGGGIAMADAFRSTGLVEWVGARLEVLEGVPPLLVILAIATLLTFLTEVTSNTATASIMLPILGGAAAPALGVHPLLLMIPAALSVSCAFMLPVATPPNAIVFGGGHLTVPQMARAGFLLNLAGIVIITTLTYLIAVPVFGIAFNATPVWADPAAPAQ